MVKEHWPLPLSQLLLLIRTADCARDRRKKANKAMKISHRINHSSSKNKLKLPRTCPRRTLVVALKAWALRNSNRIRKICWKKLSQSLMCAATKANSKMESQMALLRSNSSIHRQCLNLKEKLISHMRARLKEGEWMASGNYDIGMAQR